MPSPAFLARRLATVLAAAALTLAGCRSAPTMNASSPYYELGGFHHAVTTKSPDAQAWFDRGLALCYAFNREEAIRCFDEAVKADPDCAMAYWGLAYAWGPHINDTEMTEEASRHAHEAVLAAERAGGKTAVERDLIAASGRRYAWPPPAERAALDRAYADAMREVDREHPDDPDVCALFAESLMMLRPWKFWSADGEPAPETPEIVATLETGLRRTPDHAALCHFYIHTMEASPTPEKALPAANELRDRMPGAGHLVHMPAHIDIRMGHYEDAVVANQKAIAADMEYVKDRGRNNFYSLYRAHNYHFLVYSAMFEGRSELALTAAREMVEQLPPDMVRQMPDMLDSFMPTPIHVLVRFGRWEDILEEPEPPAYLPASRAVWHYARAIAYAATGRVAEAERERKAFLAARASVPPTSTLFNNTSDEILGVAEEMMDGEIEYRRGDYRAAFAHLTEAVRRDDALNYDEPWGWMQPARHALGALLLEQARVAEAEAVYRADLVRHPENPWALHGLLECLERQGETDEAAAVAARLDRATARMDVDMAASCYCRLQTQPSLRRTAGESED